MKKKQHLQRIKVISNGGGTQSTALIILVAQGKIPPPDLCVMVDTEREKTNVLEYQDRYVKPLCEKIGLEYIRVKKSEYTDIDVSKGKLVFPSFFTDINNKKGKTPGRCSSKWKVEPCRRYLNTKLGQRYLSSKGVLIYFGITVDELKRKHENTGKWLNYYPLIDLNLTRQDCIKLVEDFGFPTPPRSNCWMCSNMTDNNWLSLTPEDFHRAIKFEEELRKEFPYYYLHRSLKPLSEVVFKQPVEPLDYEFTGCMGNVCDN